MEPLLHKAVDALLTIGGNTDFDSIQTNSFVEVLSTIDAIFVDLKNSDVLQEIEFHLFDVGDPKWIFIAALCHCLLLIKKSLTNVSDEMLSIGHQKNIRLSIEKIISLGLLPSLLPGVGLPIDKKCVKQNAPNSESLSPIEKHYRVHSICNFLAKICTTNELKSIVFTSYLGDYLAALFQLSYAPISKPKNEIPKIENDFVMTDALWNKLQDEQKHFKAILDGLLLTSYPPLVMKEIIVLQGNKNPFPPPFMKRALTRQLSSYLISDNGLINMFKCFLDSSTVDIGMEWKYIDMIVKIISIKHGTLTVDEYLCNICQQLNKIVYSTNNRDYIKVAAACISNLLEKYPDNSFINELLNSILKPFLFNTENKVTGSILLTDIEVNNAVDILEACFNESKLCIPICFLSPIVNFIFCLRSVCKKTMKITTKLNRLILKHINSELYPLNEWFFSNIFSQPYKDMAIQNGINLETTADGVQIKCTKDNCNVLSVEMAFNCLLTIVSENTENCALGSKLFIFCLDMVSNQSHLKTQNDSCNLSNKLHLDDESRKNSLIVLHTLEKLSEIECVISYFKKNPSLIINFIANSLLNAVKDEQQIREKNYDESVVVSLVLLTTIIPENINYETLQDSIKSIKVSLEILEHTQSSEEIQYLCKEVGRIFSKNMPHAAAKESKFSKAISEICDALIPVRGHGLMQLTKLIKRSDPETISKKHIVQCIFQENLTNDDSYIYLASINGLASLAVVSTEYVLETLTKEYMKYEDSSPTFNEMKHNEHRLKIGETLVQITKNLGELALPHKTLLLNTFLSGCHDHDELIRASSLSNLAEIAQVMSYKLGSVIFVILSSVENILKTDKSPECRRAAVLFISSLIKGLGKEALHFLRDSLLHTYRTLKHLYNDKDEDATVKLHAQVALEELNSIVKDLLLKPLEMEKKIFILDDE